MGLRSYRAGDAVAMYALDCLCFEEAFRFSLRAMRRFAEGPGAIVVVEEVAGRMVGFAIAELDGESVYLVTLDVDPTRRRGGMARHMLGWIESKAIGARWMGLHVYAGNAGAIAFYEREGFSLAGRERDFYGPGWDALVYSRAIVSG